MNFRLRTQTNFWSTIFLQLCQPNQRFGWHSKCYKIFSQLRRPYCRIALVVARFQVLVRKSFFASQICFQIMEPLFQPFQCFPKVVLFLLFLFLDEKKQKSRQLSDSDSWIPLKTIIKSWIKISFSVHLLFLRARPTDFYQRSPIIHYNFGK